MLDEHKQAINEKLLDVDEHLKEECYTFVVKNSKPQAEENCNDDIVIADAICIQMAKQSSKKPIHMEQTQPQSFDSYMGL